MGAPPQVLDLIERFERNRDAYLHPPPTTRPRCAASSSIRSSRRSAGTSTTRPATPRPTRTSSTRTRSRSAARPRRPDYCFRDRRRAQVLRRGQEARGQPQGRRRRRPSSCAATPGRPSCRSRILTDFEEFAVYDCRVQARQDRRQAIGGAHALRALRAVRRRAGTRSPASSARRPILQGSFDQLRRVDQGARRARPRSTPPSSTRSSAGATRWRATSPCATRRSRQRELNFAVQATIDRIIFLRICEDRGIEAYGAPAGAAATAATSTRACVELFREADERYNSGLFHFEQEKGRAERARRADARPRHRRQGAQGHPQAPLLPRQPLRVLRAAGRHPRAGLRAVPGQGDPPHRRPPGRGRGQARGQEGRRRLLHARPTSSTTSSRTRSASCSRARRPSRRPSLRILDPACGSGSFLIGAYQYLLDWHRDWYVERRPREARARSSSRAAAASGGSPRPRRSASCSTTSTASTSTRRPSR